jgi:hypothetical protein
MNDANVDTVALDIVRSVRELEAELTHVSVAADAAMSAILPGNVTQSHTVSHLEAVPQSGVAPHSNVISQSSLAPVAPRWSAIDNTEGNLEYPVASSSSYTHPRACPIHTVQQDHC